MTQLAQHRPDSCVALRPLEEGHAQLSIEEENGEEHITDLATLGHREAILDPNHASLTVDNSNDVIVGPVTQFYAPVTIYQHVNGQINAEGQNTAPEAVLDCAKVGDCKEKDKASFRTKAHNSADHNTPELRSTKKQTFFKSRYFIAAMIAATSSFICVGIFYIIMAINRTSAEDTTSTAAPTINPGNIIGPRYEFITRQRWNAAPPKEKIPRLNHPIPFVVIKHTGGGFAKNYDACTDKVRNLQEMFFNKKHPDIDYNFLVCGDENVYFGRGWDFQNQQKGNTIDVVFIGTFSRDKMSSGMDTMTQRLLREGVKLGKLAKNYTLIAHSQTMATISPGQNVLDVIQNWEQYDGTVKL